MPSWFRSALLLPWPLPKLVKALLDMAVRRDPTILTSIAGTVGISSVGKFGKAYYHHRSPLQVLHMLVSGLRVKMRPEALIFGFGQLLKG